jgi:CheY-like chemotaxis protein
MPTPSIKSPPIQRNLIFETISLSDDEFNQFKNFINSFSLKYLLPICKSEIRTTLEILLSDTNDNNNDNNDNDYDIIILDTHLHDISGFEVARKIRNKLPHKRIILTTTNPLDNIGNMIDSIGIKSQDVLLKPFIFSELFSIIKEPGVAYNPDY